MSNLVRGILMAGAVFTGSFLTGGCGSEAIEPPSRDTTTLEVPTTTFPDKDGSNNLPPGTLDPETCELLGKISVDFGSGILPLDEITNKSRELLDKSIKKYGTDPNTQAGRNVLYLGALGSSINVTASGGDARRTEDALTIIVNGLSYTRDTWCSPPGVYHGTPTSSGLHS